MKTLTKSLAYVVLWTAITAQGFGDPSPFGGGSASPSTSAGDPFGGRQEAPVVRETFRVAQTNAATRPKLLELFEECKKNYVIMSNGTACTRTDAEALVAEIKNRNAEAVAKSENEKGLVRGLIVFQRLNARTFLAKAWWSNDLVYITTKSDVDAFNGDRMPPMYLLRSGDYSYTAVSGAARNVKAYIQTKEYSETEDGLKVPQAEVPKYEDLTQDSFVTALKNKRSFVVTRDESIPCKACSGTGQRSRPGEKWGSLDFIREDCGRCGATGKTAVRKEYTLTW